VLCGVLVWYGGVLLNNSLRVTHWHIDAPPSLEHDIDRVLLLQNLDFWHARPMYVREKLLKSIPDLADVTIHRQLPDMLQIQVRLRQRIGLWEDQHGRVYLVDEHGVAYRPLKLGENVNLPMLRMSKAYLPAASELLGGLRSSLGDKWLAINSEVLTNGLEWKLNFSQGQQWLLPFGEKTMQSVARLSKIIERSPWREKKWRIDMRMSKRWFFREAYHQEVI